MQGTYLYDDGKRLASESGVTGHPKHGQRDAQSSCRRQKQRLTNDRTPRGLMNLLGLQDIGMKKSSRKRNESSQGDPVSGNRRFGRIECRGPLARVRVPPLSSKALTQQQSSHG